MKKVKLSFSLIELLVVIAIITALFSLLSPSLRKLTALAYQTECQNHLKQLSLGVRAYSQDYDNWLPMAAASRSATFSTEIAPYLGYDNHPWVKRRSSYQYDGAPIC